MSPSFDFSAFINGNSPGNPDLQSSLNRSDNNDPFSNVPHLGESSSMLMPSSWALPTLESGPLTSVPAGTGGIDVYHSSGPAGSIQRESNTQGVPIFTAGAPESYRASIAAHHSHLLNSGLSRSKRPFPTRPAGFAKSSLAGGGAGGAHSAPSVPRSLQALNQKGLTLQERRRLSRRAIAEKPVSHQSSRSGSRSKHSGSSEEGMTSQTSIRTGKRHSRRHHRSSRTSSSRQEPSSSSSMPISLPRSIPSDPRMKEEDSESLYGNSKTGEIYSASGFDMLGALMRVANRPNKQIALGTVDLSCSFTVSDARHSEHPLIYCSETFTRLTGYEMDEIIGRNCRFLQSPNNSISKGDLREHTDHRAVQHLQKNLKDKQECQVSLINYRKDGTPFINLVTIIPISWDTPGEIEFFVGFQVDLMEQPGAILERTPEGLYVVNYATASAPIPVPAALVHGGTESEEEKQALLAKDLTQLIDDGSNDTKLWSRLLLDQSHDLVFVLSLKGNFLYMSPSSERLLGYKPHEMVGKSISEFCHPSDVVPLFRELKDSTSNASISAAAKRFTRADGSANPLTRGGSGQSGPRVNLLMRMRHKTADYIWIESCGKLHLEQGKGRKVVISSGRIRPIYNLPWEKVNQTSQIKEASFWTRASKDGLILNATAPSVDVIGITAHQMSGSHLGRLATGKNATALMEALKGSATKSVEHELDDGAGLVVPVISTVYPQAFNSTSDTQTVFVRTQMASSKPAAPKQPGGMDVDGAMDVGMKQGAGGFFPAAPNAPSSDRHGSSVQPSSSKLDREDSEMSPTMDSSANVFNELSTDASSSWIFELHQLKNSNRRLRETLKSLRVSRHQAEEDGADGSSEEATSSASGGGSTNQQVNHSKPTIGKDRGGADLSLQGPALAHLHSFSNSGSGSGSASGSHTDLFDQVGALNSRIPSDDTEVTSGGSSGGSDEITQAQRDQRFMMQVDSAINGGPHGPVQNQQPIDHNPKKRKHRG